MNFCEFHLNITLGIYLIPNNFLSIENGQIKGMISKSLINFIGSRKSKPFNCILVGVEYTGQKLPNGSYTGALKKIKDKEHVFLRQASAFVDTEFIDLSPPSDSEDYLILQPIIDKVNSDDHNFVFKFFDLKFLAYVLSSLFLFLLISLIMVIIFQNGNKNIQHLFNLVLELDRNKSKYLLILSIAYTIFSFITQQVFLINIKTEKVVVDISDLLIDEESVFKSKLKVFWLDGEPDQEMAKNAPTNSFLYYLWKYKNFDPPLIIDRKNPTKSLHFQDKSFALQNSVAIRVFTYIFNVLMGSKLFVNENHIFYSLPNYFYRVKEKNVKTKHIDHSVILSNEHGNLYKLIKDLENLKLIRNNDNNQVYYSVEEFIEDNTIFEAITIYKLCYLLLIYLIIMIIILMTYINHHLILILKKI